MQYVDGQPWRNYVESQLKEMNIVVLNPYNHPFINSSQEDNDVQFKLNSLLKEEKYDEVSKIMKKVRSEDLRCIDICDFIFCYIDPKYPTCGAWEELFTGNRAKKPIFFVSGDSKKTAPFWVFGTIPHKYIYNSIDDALNMLKKIDNGSIPIDSDRWRLLRTEFR